MEYPNVITVRVTAEHIAKGKRGRCRACPIALALNEQTGGEWFVHYAKVYDGAKPYTPNYRLSERALAFADAFDYRQTVSPATFQLTKVELGGRQ